MGYLKQLFGIEPRPVEPTYEEKVEQLARELHKIDSDKVGHSVMAGERGIYNISWPSWDQFSEESRENYRERARERLSKEM